MNKDRFRAVSVTAAVALCLLLCSCAASGGDLANSGDDFPDIADTVTTPADTPDSPETDVNESDEPDETPAEGKEEDDVSDGKVSDAEEEPTPVPDDVPDEDTGDNSDPTPAVPVKAESVSVDKTEITVYVGESVSVNATVLPSDTEDKSLTWSSSDTKVASVDKNGVVSGVSQGSATVTVKTANGKSAAVSVTVLKRPVAVDSITLLPADIEIYEGETATAVAYIQPDDADDKTVKFTSSDPSVVTVNEKGLITAVKAGTATVKATSSNGKTASIPVTVLSRELVESNYEYYYNKLSSEREQRVYVAIRDAMASCLTEVSDPIAAYAADTDVALIERIFRFVLLDHPEFFHVNPEYSCYTVGGVVTYLSLSYNMSAKEYEKALEYLDGALEPLFEKIKYASSERERALVAYNYVKERFVYDKTDLTNGCHLYNAFVSGKAVCEGYSKLFGYILKKSGIVSVQVTGDIEDGGHQWTMANIDGSWYHFDPTWDDPLTTEAHPDTMLNLNYFAVPDEIIYDTRTAHMSGLIPKANSLDANYFVINRLVLADLSTDSMSSVAQRSDKLVGHIAVLCSPSVYEALVNDSSYMWLMVGYVADDASSLTYAHDENAQVIEIFYK